MKLILIILLSIYTLQSNAQKGLSKMLTTNEINEIFDDGLKSYNNIAYPIYRVYAYNEDNKRSLLVLTESVDEVHGTDTLSKNIKAFIFKQVENEYTKVLEINDNILPELNEEKSIFFWPKYISIEKVGKAIVPIIVYGSLAMNNYMDGRMKIIIAYNKQKIVIRHQNSTFDGERVTQVDKAFYSLPASIQRIVQNKIVAMEKAEKVILAYNWQQAMRVKSTTIK